MNYESIKKKLEERRSTETSQTDQSGFSAYTDNRGEAIKQRLSGYRSQMRSPKIVDPDFIETPVKDYGALEKTSDISSRIQSGKEKYEADKNAYYPYSNMKFMEYLGYGRGGWTGEHRSYEEMPKNREGWGIGMEDRYIKGMDPDTLDNFYLAYDTDPDSAINYANEYQTLKAQLKAEKNAQKREEIVKNITKLTPTYYLVSSEGKKAIEDTNKTIASMASMVGTPIDLAETAVDYVEGGMHFSKDVAKGNTMPFTSMGNQFKSEVSQDIIEATPILNTKEGGLLRKLGIENWANLLYDVGYSSAQSALVMGTFGGWGLAFFGTSAAASTLQESLDKGDSEEIAMAKAFVSGVVEVLTEKVSFEQVLKAKNALDVGTKIANVLKAGVAEASEEGISEISNYLADVILSKDESEFAKAKAKYISYGGKYAENATGYAIAEWIPDFAYANISGFLSGLVMSGGATAAQDTIATSNARSDIAKSRATGEYADLIESLNASDYMQGQKPLTEESKTRKVIKAYRGAMESIEQASIKDRLMEETTYAFEGDAEATAKAIYDKANGYALSATQKRLLNSQTAQKVLTEYTEGKAKSGTHEWVDRAVLSQQYATSKSAPEITSWGIDYLGEQTLAREAETQREAKAAEDKRVAEYRKEQLVPYAERYGLDIDNVLAQHADLTTNAYRKAIQDSFNLASAGYTLEQVQKTVQLPMEGVLLKAYNNGVTAYAKSKGAAPTQRVNIRSNAKIELASESDVARNAPNAPYKAVNLNEVKTKKPKVYAGMLFLSKFVAPRINRKIVFFDGGANTGGWRTADSIGINIGGSFELYRKTGNVVGLFMHEFGHDLRADSQELYDELRQIVINDIYKGDADKFDREIKAEMSSRQYVKETRGEGEALDYINAEEEVIGNALAKVAESPESLERVFAENKGKQSIQKLFDMLKKLIGDIKEFFASFGHANSIADIIDEDALSKIEGVLQRYVEQIDNTPVGRIAESLPTDTTEITDVADATKYSIVSFAEGCGFKIDPETHAWQLKFPATRVTPTDIRNSPIGALIMFSKEMGDIGERGGITEKEANDQIQMFTDIANMCIESADFSMTMQFVGSSIFTGLKANSDKQYGTTFDFPSICTKTQAVIDAMSREMVRKQGGLTKEEIAVIYTKVWFDNNPVPCPECYVFSRWVGIGGLLDNIWHFQNIYSKMNPEQVRAEYKKYDAIFAKQVEELNAKKKSGDKVLTKNQIKNEQKKKYEKEYASLIEKQQKAQDGGAPFTEADEARLKEITPIYDTLRSMTYIQKVYFADDKMAVVNKNAFVPAEVLFDLNRGEDFAKKYPEAWAFRTTQGAGYGKAITPYAEEVLGEGIIGTVNVTKQANAKAKFGREISDNITERKSNPFLESKGELTAEARKTLMTARKKQLNQAYIGGQRFQSTSDARYENFLDYLIAALEVQAMGGMVQMYTKVSGAVEATNAWGFSNNQSLMPKGGGIVNGVIQDTAHGGMRPSVAFENRQKFEYAGTITIGVNDEHIRAMFGDVNRDFIIPYHASGGDRLLIAAMRATLDPDANVVQSTDYTKEQSEKILNDSLLDDPADVHKFREQRLAILTRKGNLDMDYINAPGNELLRRVYDSVNSGIYKGATVAKGVCEAQIFPNEYWDTSLSYEESGKIVEDYLEYCRRLGFLHKFSGKTQTYDRKTNTYKLTQLNGRDAQGKEVPLTDLAYKNGNPEDGVEPYYWKVLVDRRMYGNNGQYLQQRTIKVTADTAKYATTFAGGKENQNAGSVRAYSKEKSDRTLSWVDKGGVRDSVMALKDKGIELKSLPLRGEEVSKLFAPKTKSELQTKWSTRRYFEDSDAQKLANENPLINAIFETIKSSTTNTASGKFLEDVYREHPELNFTGRIQENPKGEATERFRNLINSINSVELIDDIRWFVPEFHRKMYDDNGVFMGLDYSYAQKHSKAIKLIRQICDERIESLKDAGGTNLGIKAGTAFDVKDIRNLFESWNTHAELNDLANKVFDLAERLNIAVVAVNDKNASLGDYKNLGYWHGNASRYGTGKTGLVAYQLPVFNAKTISDDSKAQIILHEMIHACTANILHAVQLLDLTQEQVDAIQPYVNLINEGMYHLKTNQKWTPSTPNMYGMKNIHEFLAELSNPEFRKALASVDDESIKEVLVYEQTLRPWINATNLETYSVSVLEKLLSDFSMEVYTEFSNRRKYRVTSDTPKFSERRVTGFYSQMGRVIEQQKADKFDARSLINMLLGKGVKAEEIKWSGLPAFLEGKKSISKSDLMEFVQGSMLDVTEETLSGDETRHKEYTIEGDYSDNYREFLFKWSNLGYSNDYMDLHWEKPNVLAHARVDDTKDAEGNDVLFIEEIQSDWHNAAATAKGYMSADDFEKKRKIRQPISYFEDWLGDAHWAYGSKKQNSGPRIDEFNVKMKEFGAPWRIMFDHGAYNLREGNEVVLKGETWGGFLDELWDVDFTDYEEVGNELYGTMPPEAPFKNNKYTDFVVKNMLHRAAEEGYEKIAWTTAKTQSDRWSDEYSKAYEIEYDHDIPKFLEKFGKQWGVKPTHEKLENGVIAWTFPITDAMQNSVVYEGQPMYSMRRIEDHTTIKSGSLFSGGGLLEQGLEYQLLTHEFGVEYDASIAATWKENNGDGKIYAGKAEGNVFNFDGKQYKGKMFHIHASPVCHNLSPAKHGYGEQPSDIESAKKTLQIFLDAEAPVYTVENAELYAKTESARIIKEGLEKAGYIVDIGVYNSADYGSAQSRTRTIIRAVRGDLMMPDRARKIPRTRTWDQVTSDLWDGLERITEKEVPDFYLKAVKNTGIDINNVKVPTLLLQTTTGGKVTYAVEGTQSPTLTTHCHEAKLLLPGGVICNVTPQFMGRLMGLPDDFKYPHWKDGTLKKTIPYKIIGNGIPVELTKAVVGGVIESAYEQTEGRSLYSIRRVNNDLSPREYLTEAALETIRSPKERAEFERLASEYRTLDDKSITLQNQIDDLNLEIDETYWKIKALEDELLKTSASNSEKVTNLIKRYGSASEALQALRSDLRGAQSKLRDLRSDLAENEEKMHDILTVPLVERIVDEQRKLTREYEQLLESTKAADQQKLANLRATMGEKVQEEIDRRVEMRKNLTAKFHEREGVNYYLPRLQSALKDLNANVAKAPMPLRGPVYRFFSLFDFKTRDKEGNVRKGQANIDRQAEQDRINSLLGTGEGSIQEWLGKYNVEISEDVQTWLEDTRNFLTWMLLNKETLNVRTASAKQIQSAYHLARTLNTIIKSLSKAYTDANLDMSRIDKMAAEHADSLGIRRNAEVSGVAKLMRYEHAQPITVFDRLGDAGKAMFKLLAQGEGKRARNEQQIADFIDTWNQSDVKKWIDPKQAVEVKFQVLDEEGNPEIGEDGEEVYTSVKMTPAQMMTIYCTAKDAAGYRHLMVGGFKLADVIQTVKGRRYHINDTIRKITETDLENLIATMNTYDENLIPFADSLQNFIDTVGTMWGNQVSIKRYGYEQFDIENYFPLITVLRNRTSDISKKAKLGELTSQIFSLINKSFTKDRLANASNPLIIQNVFDVFFEHMEDMAIYNAYALPVLDTMRFLQYTQYDEDGKEVWNLDEKLNNAYGNGVMQNYIMRLLVSINGERPMTNAENLALTALRLRNRVAVAANLRVVLQQPLSIARALEVIPAKYITPFGHFMDTYHEMIAHSDIALKKSQGYYGADVKRSLMEKALGSGTAWYNKYYDFVNKATEIGMKPAELGDMLTWTTLWNACRNWVKDINPSLEGDAFLDAVDDKFTDIIYRTQVVDSVLQKSEFMRQKDFFHRSTSSFKGEPTTSYNTLLRLYDRIIEARQRGENLGQVWNSVKKPMLNAFIAYGLNTLLIALATSVADAFRDDDDYETWWEKFQDALYGKTKGFFKSNLFESVNFLDLPVFSEAFSLLQGYKADRVDLMFIQETIDIANSISGFIKKANWKDAMKLLGGVSMLSGLPMQNLAREVFAIWNNTIGVIDPSMKIETSPAPKSLGYDQFYTALSNENYVRATELIDEIMDNAKDANEAYQGITDKVHDAFVNGKITEAEAFDYLNLCEGYVEGVERTDKQQRNRIENWKKAMEEKGLKWKQ